MRTSSNGSYFRVAGPSCGEFTGHRWIPLMGASDLGALMFSLMYAWFNVWVNNGDAGGLRRPRARNDVTVMIEIYIACFRNLVLVPLNDTIEWRCSAVHFLHDITYDTMITVAKLRSDFKLTTGYLCLAVTGELWDACCEDVGRNCSVVAAPHCIQIMIRNQLKYITHVFIYIESYVVWWLNAVLGALKLIFACFRNVCWFHLKTQPNAVVARSNFSLHYIWHYDDSGKFKIGI